MAETSIPQISLRVNFSWMFVGRAVYAASQWSILIILAKLGTPQVVGQYGFALALTVPVLALLNLNLRVLLATDVKDEYSFGTYLGLRLVTAALALLITAGIALWNYQVFFVILAMGLAKSFESISDVLFGLMQKYEQMDYIAKSNILNGTLSFACVTGVYLSTRSLGWSILSLAIVRGGVLLLYDLRNTLRLRPDNEYSRPRFHIATWGKLAWMAAPLGVATVLTSLSTNVPRYFIEYFHGQATLGYFTAISYTLVAGDLVFTALRQASAPRLSKYYPTSRPKFVRLLLQLVSIAIVLGVGGISAAFLFGQKVLRLFYTASYAQYADILVWIMVIGMLRYVFGFLYSAMIVMRLLRIQVYILMVSTGVGIIIAWLFIPSCGQMGAIWAMLAMASLNLIFGSSLIIGQPLSIRHEQNL